VSPKKLHSPPGEKDDSAYSENGSDHSDHSCESHTDQMKQLEQILKKTKFFKERKIGQLNEIAMNMQMEEHSQGSTIFNIGDPGKKFYIVLKGSVGVYIPQFVKVEA
jgi:hypothetical protein